MPSLTASHHRFDSSEVILAQIFQSTVEDVRKSINSLWVSTPPEEEPLTFHICLSLVSKLLGSKDRILCQIHEDLRRLVQIHVPYSHKPPNIDDLRNEVKVHVIPHHKQFEGKVSGADFGLVLTVPVASTRFNSLRVESMSTGCIVQAKRIILTGTKCEPIVFGRGFNRLFKYRRFALFLLYRFSRDSKNQSCAFGNISFVPCKDFRKKTAVGFKAAVKKFLALASQQSVRTIDVQDMVKGVFAQDFSTCEERDIKEIIGLSHLPIIHIDISFPPGWEPPNLVRTKVREEQPITIKG